jgi:23S rRNA (uracil1939-C5)-methyltransferase
MQKTFTMRAERYAHDGAAEGEHEGKKVRVHGMLVGEEGTVEARKKQGLLIGTLKEIVVASPSRKLPDEPHYLICSPWQVMEYPAQIEAKRELLSSLFSYHENAPRAGFTPARRFYGYRTKVEFSFADREDDRPIPLSLAFHERGGGARRVALPRGCMLASEDMNRVALAILAKLLEKGYIARDLKSLVVRESKSEGRLIAVLFAKRETIDEIDVSDIPGLVGFIAFHSTEKSPASVPTKHLYTWGEDHLTEVMEGISIRYSWDSFFQNNVEVFQDAVGAMREHIEEGDRILELYSGAGTIGLLLGKHAASVYAVEIVPAAVDAANLNARVNGIDNYESECLPAEAIDASLIEGDDVLLLDPPRAGLHPKLIAAIRDRRPKRIVYLSCNPETQARDYSALADLYRIDRLEGYDFYPGTPHLESLLVLSLREK